jgi:hypothetical protein
VAVHGKVGSDTFALPIAVYPALRPAIALIGNRLVAEVHGGDGSNLFLHWVAGSREYWGPSIPAPSSGQVTLTVIDGTGTQAQAIANLANGSLTGLHDVWGSPTPFAPGAASGASC